MGSNDSKSKSAENYEQITQTIIDGLKKVESGEWETPWNAGFGRPRNGHSGNVYSGVNVVLLWMSALQNGFSTNRWYTYNQAKDEGGHVRKGETSTKITFFKFWDKTIHRVTDDRITKSYNYQPKFEDLDHDRWIDQLGVEDKEELLEEIDTRETSETVPMLRTWSVFNEDQIEGVDKSENDDPDVDPDMERLEAADQFIASTGADIIHNIPQAAYSPTGDHITMPKFEAFDDEDAYYSTVFHELTHWTGHDSRLDRDFGGRFGDQDYAFEELIAELGSAFLCSDFGIDSRIKDSTRYVKHWIEILEDDKYSIFTAAREAENAVDYLKEGEKGNGKEGQNKGKGQQQAA